MSTFKHLVLALYKVNVIAVSACLYRDGSGCTVPSQCKHQFKIKNVSLVHLSEEDINHLTAEKIML